MDYLRKPVSNEMTSNDSLGEPYNTIDGKGEGVSTSGGVLVNVVGFRVLGG